MNDQTIGTCSICGGAVTLPTIWHGVIPPAPRCRVCGASGAQHGPVIPMTPAPRVEGAWTLRLSPYEHDHTAAPMACPVTGGTVTWDPDEAVRTTASAPEAAHAVTSQTAGHARLRIGGES